MQVINRSTSVIFGLVRLIVLNFNRQKSISRGKRLSVTHALCLQGVLLCKKLSNKQSGNGIVRPVRLITL